MAGTTALLTLDAAAKGKGKAPRNVTWRKGPIKLPTWKYGDHSAASDTLIMFRGNPTHTFYGTGPIPTKPALKWKFRMERVEALLHGRPHVWTGTGWTGQASVLGGYVFIGSQDKHFYCFETETGQLRWKYQSGRWFKSSPCLYENRIYVGNVDNYLRCMDAQTGRVLWHYNMGRDLDSSPCVWEGRLYIGGENGYLHCFDPKRGKLLWRTFLGGIGPNTKPGSNGVETSPAVADGEVYAANYDGYLFCVDARTGAIRWKFRTGDDTDASPVIVGDRLYIAAEDRNPYLYCVSRQQKGKLIWKLSNRKGWWSTPAIVGDRLWIGGNNGILYCIEAKTGKVIWTFKAGGPIWSSPAVVDDRVVFGSYTPYLHMLDANSGKQIWKFNMGGRSHSTPCVVNGSIYVGCSAGTFYCFGA